MFPLRVYGDLGQIHFTPFWIDDDETFRRALKYSTIAINCMGMETDTKSTSLEKLHIDAARKVAKTCREMGIKRLIHISALNCSPNPKVRMDKRDQFSPRINRPARCFRLSGIFHQKWLAFLQDQVLRRVGGSRRISRRYYHQAVGCCRMGRPIFPVRKNFGVFYLRERPLTFVFSLSYYMQHSRLIGNVLHLWNKGLDTIKQPLYIKDFARGIYEIFRRRPDETAGKTYQFVGFVSLFYQ